MDTNRMRYFLSLSKTGSVSKAAELHHISPPAFSKAMKIFEGEVGQTLLIPHGRGILLTDDARALVLEIEIIIEQIDRLAGGRRQQANVEPQLKIATFEVFSTHFMERALPSMFANFQCMVFEFAPGQMEEAVASGRADLGLTYLPIPHPQLDHLRVQEIEMGVFGAKHPKTKLRIDEMPFAIPLTPVEGSPNKVRGLDGWPDDAFPRRVLFGVGMLETALGLCRRGLAHAYIPKFIAHLHNDVVKPAYELGEVALPPKFPKTKSYVYLIKRKSDQEGEAAKKLAVAVRKFCK